MSFHCPLSLFPSLLLSFCSQEIQVKCYLSTNRFLSYLIICTVKSCVLDKIQYKIELLLFFFPYVSCSRSLKIWVCFHIKTDFFRRSCRIMDPGHTEKLSHNPLFNMSRYTGMLHPLPFFFSCRAVICCVTVMGLLDEITTIILLCFFSLLFFLFTLIRKTAISFDSYMLYLGYIAN